MAKAKKEVVSEDANAENIQFDCLVVTKVSVFVFKENPSFGKTKAIASVTLNDQLHLSNLRVIDGSNGFFVAYPNAPFYKGEDFRSIFYPLTRQCREHIENCVLEKYQEVITN